MRRALALLAAAWALLPAAAAATTITSAPPHDPVRGCEAVRRLIDNLNAGRLRSADQLFPYTAFYSDALGAVDESEEAAFLQALLYSEGRRDARPMRLYGVFRLLQDRYQPTYLVVIERHSWRETRLEEDDMLEVREVRDPRFARDMSYWLATFQSNDIVQFREARELYRAMDDDRRLRRCPD